MNRILIVGHPQSGYQEVEALLNVCGMKAARPSRREAFTPEEIGTTLCKAHSAQPLHQIDSDQPIQQIEVGPVWHGMALDLMLGNIDQELWGWADPQSIYLLDYWKKLDPKITFILVYNDAHTLLTDKRNPSEHLSQNDLQRRINIWQTYNAALLHFYYRNPECCLLVHAQQVRQSANKYLQQVQSRIGARLVEAGQLLTTQEEQIALLSDQGSHCPDSVANSAQLQFAANISCTSSTDIDSAIRHQAEATAHATDQDALKYFLAEAIINQHPQALQLYEELQSAADLPLATSANRGISALDAWRGMTMLDTITHELAAQAQEQQAQAQQQISQTQAESRALSSQLLTAISQGKEHRQEIDTLLSNLHQTQEELERHYLQNQEIKTQADLLAKQLAAKHQAQVEQLKQANTKAEQAKASSELLQENEQLLVQLRQVQEELERYYLENQSLKINGSQTTKASSKPAHYGAADRVKRQLSYRLGATMIERSRSFSGLITMPWALAREARRFKRERLQRAAQKLPPVSAYRDAHEADKVKQHLSYRLGATLLANSRSPIGWVKLPWALKRAVKDFRRRQQT